MEIFSKFSAILKTDLKLSLRRNGGIINLLAFFLIVTALFPLSLGADSRTLNIIGASIIWVASLLVSNLSISRIFEEDFDNGILEQLILAPIFFPILIMAKILSHWLLCGLPVSLFSPFLVLMFGIDTHSALILMFSLLIGTPVMSLICTIGAGITLGVKRGGTLASLLTTPLYIPTLIFGSGMAMSAPFGTFSEQVISNAAGLFVLFLIMLPLCLWSVSASLKLALEE